ncbi:MAG: class I SAM-dependent methyltransferase [Anaerolineaceae bacterium]|nr:class I SAM-dependent methyltransferase [Anaerolineaceae bacterium]
MDFDHNQQNIRTYFDNKLKTYGTTPQGVDWNSTEAHHLRFFQLLKVINEKDNFSILDFGSGFGSFADYLLGNGYQFDRYVGFDILESMVEKGRQLHQNTPQIEFTNDPQQLPEVDYSIACGVFNIRLEASYQQWTDFVIQSLTSMNHISKKGFSANFLTKYSDADRMRADLYYADPCFLFDYCKTHFSKNVAVLHDYNLYDFTLLVRKFPSP